MAADPAIHLELSDLQDLLSRKTFSMDFLLFGVADQLLLAASEIFYAPVPSICLADSRACPCGPFDTKTTSAAIVSHF